VTGVQTCALPISRNRSRNACNDALSDALKVSSGDPPGIPPDDINGPLAPSGAFPAGENVEGDKAAGGRASVLARFAKRLEARLGCGIMTLLQIDVVRDLESAPSKCSWSDRMETNQNAKYAVFENSRKRRLSG